MRSFITVAAESARAAARQLDDRIAREGTSGLGPLAGVPLGIKVRMQACVLASLPVAEYASVMEFMYNSIVVLQLSMALATTIFWEIHC